MYRGLRTRITIQAATNMLLPILLLFVSGCSKDTEEAHQKESHSLHRVEVVGESTTRSVLQDLQLLWEPGDKFSLFGGGAENTPFVNISSEVSASAQFEGALFSSPDLEYRALVPYRADNEIEGEILRLTLPNVQPFRSLNSFAADVNPAVAQGQLSSPLKFKNLCGVLRVQLTGSSRVKEIAFTPTTAGQPVTGRALIDLSTPDAPSLLLDEQGSEILPEPLRLTGIDVQLDEQNKSFYLVVPPGTYSGFTISVTDHDGVVKSKTTEREITVKRSVITSLAPMTVHPYVSYFYYSYGVEESITPEMLGLTPETFELGPICISGNTLFVANNKSQNIGILTYDLNTKQVLNYLREWQYGGNTVNFGTDSRIEDVTVSNDKIYVTLRESRVEVFNLNSYDFITRIGNGDWRNEIFHGIATMIKDGYIYVRVKNQVRVFQESDVVPEKYQNIRTYCRSSQTGITVNNSFNPYQMAIDGDIIWLTEFGSGTTNRKITCIDPLKLKQGDNSVELLDKNREISLEFSPTGLSFHNTRLLIAGNGKINVYDRNKEQIIKSFGSVSGATFNWVQKLYMDNGNLWVTDTGAKRVYKIFITVNEIREFEKIPSTRSDVRNLIRCKDATGNYIIVDLDTHEIVNKEGFYRCYL